MKEAFNEQLYKKIPINNLILFGIHLVLNKEKECRFEELTKKCFALFPKIFSLHNNPNWPDTRKLDRPLRMLRNKKLIIGNPQDSFSLTSSGKKIALEIANTLTQKRLL
ncbi:MAG: hypothetical protein ABH876_00415 [Patescibacteria group bacterium]|nr:hypothetical protein [Patescibacteria group bacterium]MBU1877252.1 hypothetical protein [Patescibacteria group bacterium]